ncbi:F-box domain-containing protein [Favolaschia claudopus]|uniref:F-box domain-containing protein n=1 Tax=Favolaschia claudopus TaxID=2862362 RepID=A0AAV9ZUP5_9AGAR
MALGPGIPVESETTAFSSSDSVSQAQLGLDQEILKYQEEIRALRSRRNALSLIGRLPPEMLSRVFMFCQRDGHLWIREVSHICRYWREVAIGCPNLWSCISLTPSRWAKEMLHRSKMAPLSIKANLAYRVTQSHPIFSSLLGHLSRIRELDVHAGGDSISELLDLTESAPCLQSLILNGNSVHGYQLPDEQRVLEPNFLNGDTPRLRRLELTRFTLPPNSPLLSNLFHLKLHSVPSLARLAVPELVAALEKMPELETLDLDNALPPVTPDEYTISTSPPRLSLPRLKRIVLGNAMTLQCADILNHLSFAGSLSPTIRISCVSSMSSPNEWDALNTALANVQCTGKTRPLRRLSLRMSFGSMGLKAWSRCGESEPAPDINKFSQPMSSFFASRLDPGGVPVLDIECMCHAYTDLEPQRLLVSASKSLPLRDLQHLSISADYHEMGTQTWIDTFGNLPNLHSIHVTGKANNFIAALREDVIIGGVKQVPAAPPVVPSGRRASLRRPKVEVSGGLFFPALRNLTLEKIDFALLRLVTLQNTLMERCERKQELWKLTLLGCSHFVDPYVATLEEIVVDVDWDGCELGFTDEESEPNYSEDDDMYSDYGYGYGYEGYGYGDYF